MTSKNTTTANQDVFDTYIDDDRRDVQKMMLNKYDLDGDGKLDTSEQQNIGHDILRMRDVANMQKKLLIAASSFIVLLTIANIGSSYCAMVLARDLKVASNGVMKDMAGGNVKTEGIAPKVTLYEVTEGGRRLKSKRDIHRKLQGGQESDGTNFDIQGFVDVQGVSDILDGGLTQFLTDSGMQSCDVTGFQKRSDTVYILFTSCGRGRLVLQQQSQQGTQGMRRKLYSDQSTFDVALVTISNSWGNEFDCQSAQEVSDSLKFYGSQDDPQSFWICDKLWIDWYPFQYTTTAYGCFDMIFDLNRIVEDLENKSAHWLLNSFDPSTYCMENESVLSLSPSPTESYPTFQPVQAPTTQAPSPRPSTLQPTQPGLQFSASGGYHVCALFSSKVQCVGNNYSGQLGKGDKTNAQTPVDMNLPTGLTPIQVVTGTEHTCVLFAIGSVYCVGWNKDGQLGDQGTSGVTSNALVQVQRTDDNTLAPLSGVKKIVPGGSHTCAIFKSTNPMYCWGKNTDTQLSFSNDESTRDIRLIALSLSTTCIVPTGNRVKCTNSNGGFFTVDFGDNDVIIKLTAGSRHFCALLENGTAKCFGSNIDGQLGDGSKTDRYDSAVYVEDSNGSPLSDITDINAGGFSTCLLLSNKTPMCFGSNFAYQLGIASGDDVAVPVPTKLDVNLPNDRGNIDIASIHVGGSTGHVVYQDNSVFSWGNNEDGALGKNGYDTSTKIGDTVGEYAVEMDFNWN